MDPETPSAPPPAPDPAAQIPAQAAPRPPLYLPRDWLDLTAACPCDDASRALTLALVGILVWPLGIWARRYVKAAWKYRGKRHYGCRSMLTWAGGLSLAECIWTAWVVAVIIAHLAG